MLYFLAICKRCKAYLNGMIADLEPPVAVHVMNNKPAMVNEPESEISAICKQVVGDYNRVND